LGRRFRMAPGEMIMTEISRKFRADEMAATAARYALDTVQTFTDPNKAFALLLMRKRGRSALAEGRQRSAWTHLATARARTLELIEPLDDADLVRQVTPILSPVVWDLGHIANFEEQWSIRALDPPAAVVPVDPESVVIPAGPFVMGTDDRGFAYDNERPAHTVDVPRFRIDLAPVTNAQYLAFILDGGYRRRALWTDTGWLWLQE